MGIEGLNRIVSRIKQWVVDEISDHAGVADAHHSPYTDAEVDAIVATHTAISGAHHEPYTDIKAVDACDTSNKFIERDEENVITQALIIKRETAGNLLDLQVARAVASPSVTLFQSKAQSTSHTYVNCNFVSGMSMVGKGTDTEKYLCVMRVRKVAGSQDSYMEWIMTNSVGGLCFPFTIYTHKLDVKMNLFITVIKNGATQAGAGAAANEVWKTNGHAMLPDNVLMIGV